MEVALVDETLGSGGTAATGALALDELWQPPMTQCSNLQIRLSFSISLNNEENNRRLTSGAIMGSEEIFLPNFSCFNGRWPYSGLGFALSRASFPFFCQ